MPATNVYGVKIGESFKDDDGEVFTVLRFITPDKMTDKWKAVVKSDQIEEESEMLVEDLLNMQEVYT